MCYYLIVIIIANYCWWLFMNDNNNNYGGFGNSAGVLYVNPDVFNNALSVFPVDTVTNLVGMFVLILAILGIPILMIK